MVLQFSTHMVSLLDDVTLLNRAVYGGPDALASQYLDDFESGRDPAQVGNREALFVYDRYDDYLKSLGYTTLSAKDLGFPDSEIGASNLTDGLDHNYSYAGDLFRNNYVTTDTGEVPFTGAGAVALVTLKATSGGNVLNLTFRGTDADGPTADGEAGTANGQARYYGQLKALINEVYQYVSDPSHDISQIVVSGHSLGGTVADMFALYDGARFASIDGVKLSVVALASAGIDPGLLALMPDYDKSLVNVGTDGAISFNTPDWYFQYDQANDIVRNPDKYDFAAHAAEDPGQALITNAAVSLLKDHIHFEDNRLQFETPMIDQYAVSKNLDTNFLVNHYADFYELIGTEFSKAWPLAKTSTYDSFIALFGESDAVKDTPGTNNVNGWGVSADNAVDDADHSDNLFLLGLSGNDTITTGSGADFVSGGADNDVIRTHAGADMILGDIRGKSGDDQIFAGSGADIVHAGLGADTIVGGRGSDSLSGGGGADTFVFHDGDGSDTIGDFHFAGKNHDTIDLSRWQAVSTWSELKADHLSFVDGEAMITDAHGDMIVLAGVHEGDLHRADFLI
jgi:Ca2+-binding RTX toxin-like protein